MPFQMNSNGRIEFVPSDDRTPGYEGLAGSAVFHPDFSLDGDALGLDGVAEYSLGGAATAAIYAGLMKFLELEQLVKVGGMSRREQLNATRAAAWEYSKSKAVWVILIASVCAFLPGLVPVLSLVGFIGLGTMSYRLCRAFYAALSDEQLEALRQSAKDAGIDLKVPEPEAKPVTGTAAGYDEHDPAPSFA